MVAACYVLTLDSPQAMETNRQAGAYLGLRPRQQKLVIRPAVQYHQDGQHVPAQSAGAVGTVHLGRFGPDSELRRWGLSWLPAVANGAKNAPSLPWPEAGRGLLSMWRNRKKLNRPQSVAQLTTA